jgi:hypothetical protein
MAKSRSFLQVTCHIEYLCSTFFPIENNRSWKGFILSQHKTFIHTVHRFLCSIVLSRYQHNPLPTGLVTPRPYLCPTYPWGQITQNPHFAQDCLSVSGSISRNIGGTPQPWQPITRSTGVRMDTTRHYRRVQWGVYTPSRYTRDSKTSMWIAESFPTLFSESVEYLNNRGDELLPCSS